MAKLWTIILVLLTIAEIIGSKSPGKENKDKVPRLAYFLGPSSNASVHSSDIQDNHLSGVGLMKENGVLKTVDKGDGNETVLKKAATPCHRRRCKCPKRRRSQNSTAPIGSRCRCRRDMRGQAAWGQVHNLTTADIILKQHPLNHPHSSTQLRNQTIVKVQSRWTTARPSKVKRPDSSSEVNSPDNSSEEKPNANRLIRIDSPVENVAQPQLREEEDDEDAASDYQRRGRFYPL